MGSVFLKGSDLKTPGPKKAPIKFLKTKKLENKLKIKQKKWVRSV